MHTLVKYILTKIAIVNRLGSSITCLIGVIFTPSYLIHTFVFVGTIGLYMHSNSKSNLVQLRCEQVI